MAHEPHATRAADEQRRIAPHGDTTHRPRLTRSMFPLRWGLPVTARSIILAESCPGHPNDANAGGSSNLNLMTDQSSKPRGKLRIVCRDEANRCAVRDVGGSRGIVTNLSQEATSQNDIPGCLLGGLRIADGGIRLHGRLRMNAPGSRFQLSERSFTASSSASASVML